ncbi:MAG TPA: 1,6-anhydro-N-acetylmuramyl-L-alanine amidase AmpD [Gammaproteobacteria bacterium]|nr:1,6-anhydro-N-acetylmuramyl-L-alanine amidase AmpD [Gammaproteobacteria bacterium]
MHVDPRQGRLDGARFVASPNCDERPPEARIELLVVHGISLPPGEFGGPYIEQLFTNTLDFTAHPYFESLRGLEVSAHLLVRRDGELIQFVPFHCRAWHAGASSFQGRSRCNDFSVGVELEGCDDVPYTEVQYAVLAQVTRALRAAYPDLGGDRLVGHCDIAPERKTDPGPAFDWERLRADLGDRDTV